MLKTPFGVIEIKLDGKLVDYKIKPRKNDDFYPGVDGAYLLIYRYKSDYKKHTLQCKLNGEVVDFEADTGDRLEAVSMYLNNGKITIGTKCEFGLEDTVEWYGFDGILSKEGIEINIYEDTEDKDFIFGVSWLLSCNDNNEIQTWFGADQTI